MALQYFIQSRGVSDDNLKKAIIKTNDTLGLPSYSLCLEPIANNPDIVMAYCDKEMKVDVNGRFDSDRMILSHDLFYLPYQCDFLKHTKTHPKSTMDTSDYLT